MVNNFISLVNYVYTAGADPKTIPGCPEFAWLIASMPKHELLQLLNSMFPFYF